MEFPSFANKIIPYRRASLQNNTKCLSETYNIVERSYGGQMNVPLGRL